MTFQYLKRYIEASLPLEMKSLWAFEKADKPTELMKQRSILDHFSQTLAANGFAGSTRIPELVLLTMYTRYLDQPVSLVIKGPSGSGKSFSLQSALRFIPKEAYEEFSGMSEKVIAYLGNKISLKHRMLIIGEAAGMAKGNGRTLLRQLLSEHEVRYATVQKTANGLDGVELPPLEGPVGLVMTTTANGLHTEDESRMMSVHMHESAEQIRAALLAQANQSGSKVRGINYAPWHELHLAVGRQDLNVAIPFAAALAQTLPVSHFRVQRDFPKILSLISAHTLMHFCTRDRDQTGALVATLADYAVVYRLTADLVAQGIDVAVPAAIRQVVDAVRAMTTRNGRRSYFTRSTHRTSVTLTELASHLEKNVGSVSRLVEQAIDRGFLANPNAGQGKAGAVQLGEREMPFGSALPDPQELAEFLTS
jgi:hypothetical protein